jgi:hypothetical protein
MGLTIAQLSARLRCADCGGPLRSVKPWRMELGKPLGRRGHYFSAHSRLAGLPDEILVGSDGQRRAREVGLPCYRCCPLMADVKHNASCLKPRWFTVGVNQIYPLYSSTSHNRLNSVPGH